MGRKLILILLLSGLAALFVIQNTAVVEMRFLFWSIAMSRSLLMLLLLALGIILGWVLHGLFRRRMHRMR